MLAREGSEWGKGGRDEKEGEGVFKSLYDDRDALMLQALMLEQSSSVNIPGNRRRPGTGFAIPRGQFFCVMNPWNNGKVEEKERQKERKKEIEIEIEIEI